MESKVLTVSCTIKGRRYPLSITSRPLYTVNKDDLIEKIGKVSENKMSKIIEGKINQSSEIGE